MTRTTFFGEIDELSSRAVFYDNEEDDDVDEKKPGHNNLRSEVKVDFKPHRTDDGYNFTHCLIGLLTNHQLKTFCTSENDSLVEFGSFGTVGRALVSRSVSSDGKQEHSLLMLFDSSHPSVKDHRVVYFVESILTTIKVQLNWRESNPIIILDEEFTSSGHLEYLVNEQGHAYTNKTQILFQGNPMEAPNLVKNSFVASLFEQLSLSRMYAFVVRLPNPRDVWFDKTKDWPTLSDCLLRVKLNDNSPGKSLLFT